MCDEVSFHWEREHCWMVLCVMTADCLQFGGTDISALAEHSVQAYLSSVGPCVLRPYFLFTHPVRTQACIGLLL